MGEWNESKGDHHTNLGIHPNEWEELFFQTLQAPKWEMYISDEDINEYYKRQKRLFQDNLKNKGYEMLGRIWRIYQDAVYLPPEIHQLLAECLDIKKKTNNKRALSALEKLIWGCNEAIKSKSGLILLSD